MNITITTHNNNNNNNNKTRKLLTIEIIQHPKANNRLYIKRRNVGGRMVRLRPEGYCYCWFQIVQKVR